MKREDLTEDQARIAQRIVSDGESCFVTGGGGVGKSFLLRHVVRELRIRHGGDAVALLAPTGIAAFNIGEGAQTINSFYQIKLGKQTAQWYVNNFEKEKAWREGQRTTKQRLRALRVILIDEISMVGRGLFEKIEYITRMLRGSALPWGNVQLVVFGDFYQLPPVNDKFPFESKLWKRMFPAERCYELTENKRQEHMSEFAQRLNEIRVGNVSIDTVQLLRDRIVANGGGGGGGGEDVTELHPLCKSVDYINKTRLAQLPPETEHVYIAEDTGDERVLASMDKNSRASRELRLREGAIVILTWNLDAANGLCNGAVGTVIGWGNDDGDGDSEKLPLVDFHGCGRAIFIKRQITEVLAPASHRPGGGGGGGGEKKEQHPGLRVVASRKQLPLMLGWAITIHKSQGLTLDRVRLSLDRCFAPGQAYVALSRARSIESIEILGRVQRARIKTAKEALAFYKQLERAQKK